MTTTPIRLRGWCDLEECQYPTVPQDCIRLGPITVCEPCLLELGKGINLHQKVLDTLEQMATSLDSVGEPEIADRVREDREKFASASNSREVV